jgi:hypothetical protein
MAKDIFDAAVGEDDLGPEHQLGPEPAPEPGDNDRPRDEHGRYKTVKAEDASGEQQPPEAEQQPSPPPAESPPPDGGQPQPQESDQYRVPLRELLDTRERAQAAEREREELRRQIAAIQRQQKAPEPQATPDIFADPDAYTAHITQQVNQTVATMQLNFDLQLAEVKHGETFTKAYDAFVQAVGNPAAPNPTLYHSVMNSRSPGSAIVDWYKRESVIREVGQDPAAYRQKLQDELLKDDAFLAKVIEQVNGRAAAPSGSRPTNVTRLPSLNRQSNAGGSTNPLDSDGSPLGIWDAATR